MNRRYRFGWRWRPLRLSHLQDLLLSFGWVPVPYL
jgi:hypothetical protein